MLFSHFGHGTDDSPTERCEMSLCYKLADYQVGTLDSVLGFDLDTPTLPLSLVVDSVAIDLLNNTCPMGL